MCSVSRLPLLAVFGRPASGVGPPTVLLHLMQEKCYSGVDSLSSNLWVYPLGGHGRSRVGFLSGRYGVSSRST